MEELERIARSEPERSSRVWQRLLATPRSCERPAERVIRVDRRGLGSRASRRGDRLRRRHGEVGLMDGDLELDLHAARDELPIEGGACVALPLRSVVTTGPVE